MNSLAARALRGWLLFQLFLALLLFLPAGTIDYPQAWAYWLVFGVATAAVTIYFLRRNPALVERRMSVGPGAEKRTFHKIIQAMTGVLLCIFYITAGLDYRFHWSTVPLSAVVLGDALVLLSFIALLEVFRQNSFASATVEIQPGQQVVASGSLCDCQTSHVFDRRVAVRRQRAGARILLGGTDRARHSWPDGRAFARRRAIIAQEFAGL